MGGVVVVEFVVESFSWGVVYGGGVVSLLGGVGLGVGGVVVGVD